MAGQATHGAGPATRDRPATREPASWQTAGMPERNLAALPKAHLHLHFTGSMRPSTLADLADEHGIRLPETLRETTCSG